MGRTSEWYFFGKTGQIKHEIHDKDIKITTKGVGGSVWIDKEDYIKALEKFLDNYRKYDKKKV